MFSRSALEDIPGGERGLCLAARSAEDDNCYFRGTVNALKICVGHLVLAFFAGGGDVLDEVETFFSRKERNKFDHMCFQKGC